MLKKSDESHFAPIPMRTLGDARVTGTHQKALGAIASYDRFNNNGRGCFKSLKELARKCGVNGSNFVTAVGQLVEWGYLDKGPSLTRDKRLHTYRILYTAQDKEWFNAEPSTKKSGSRTEREDTKPAETNDEPKDVDGDDDFEGF